MTSQGIFISFCRLHIAKKDIQASSNVVSKDRLSPFPSHPSCWGSSLSLPSSMINTWRCTLCYRLSFTRALHRNINISSWRYFPWDNLPSFLPDPITMQLQRSFVRTESWQVRSDKGPAGGRTFVRSYSSRGQFCSHTSNLWDRGNHSHGVRNGMHMPATLSCKTSWITPGKIRENPEMSILNLRFEAELSHKHRLREKNHRCKGLVWEWEAERAINLCETELLLLPSASNPAI